jgi:uncharacterized protein YprB with RNaseH-like and TPR domain
MLELQSVENLVKNEGRIVKEELKKRSETRCIHRHTVEEHPNCFRKGLLATQMWYRQLGATIGFLDIETSNLKADVGFMLSWVLKIENNVGVYGDVITKKELFDMQFDRRIVKSLLDVLKPVDILVTYYGTGFDLPFLRTRSLYWGYKYPIYGSIYNFDLYYRVKALLKLSRNSLKSTTDFFGLHEKTDVDLQIWNRARYGDKVALDWVFTHNMDDVLAMQSAFYKLEDYSKWSRKSI